MEKDQVKKILNYYLEYEIYNIANSSQIKPSKENSYIMKNKIDIKLVSKELERIKNEKIKKISDKFIGKRSRNKDELINLIIEELNNLNSEQSNQTQITYRIKTMLSEKIKKVPPDVIENFANQLCEIKSSKEFWVYAHNISYIVKNNKDAKKQPIFILKCELDNDNIKVLDVNVNTITINTIIKILLDKELSDVTIEYEEKIYKYSQEIKSSIDGGSIEHIVDLMYAKLTEYVDECLTKEKIKQISLNKFNYQMNDEYIIALDEITEDSIKNIKEDMELLKKLIENDGYIPNLLNKYFNGSKQKENINDIKYNKMHRGNYKSKYGVGERQYKIVNAINNNDLIAVEGPPGTGKTSLLKEIIANKIVERANLILENWDEKFKLETYNQKYEYYKMNWYNNNKDKIKSIVVSSKNGEAIENVGNEINKEISYFKPIAENYKRTKRKNNEIVKELAGYKGIVCLPLGKFDNIQDFKEFLYKEFIPILENIDEKESINVVKATKIKYERKIKEVKQYEQLLTKIEKIINKKQYFYSIEPTSKENIEKIEKEFLAEKENTKNKENELNEKIHNLLNQISETKMSLEENNEKMEQIKSNIEKCNVQKAQIINTIRKIENEKEEFNKIKRNIVTILINFKKYRIYKKRDFESEIITKKVEADTEDKQLEKYVDKKTEIEEKIDTVNKTYQELIKKSTKLQQEKEKVNTKNSELELIEKFNQTNEKTYWEYKSLLEMYCKSQINILNQELFQLALELNQAYIVKNKEKIIQNLKLFLPDEEKGIHICQNFYESTEIYDNEKQTGIRNLWNTLFLCFPVVTTTLDSFCKRCFHLIPEYIDLELIDEAGQIPPHNIVSALYRGKKAVIVGDIKQIEPIYSNVNRDFSQNRKELGNKFADIEIEQNSIQTIANKNTDILYENETIILNEHYRCEKNIVNFSNKNVYENKLNMNVEDDFKKPFFNNMIALDVRGKRPKDKNGKEKNENKVEMEACIKAIKYIRKYDTGKEEATIAIVTPFAHQKELLENRLKIEGLSDVKVGTVHAFQGQEKDYIIFSPTLASLEPKYAVRFIGNKYNMLNVAVTRAKKQFIYIGNLDVAEKTDNYISKLITYIRENGKVYSLYDTENSSLSENFDEEILQILQPELKVHNDNIGMYIMSKFQSGVILDAKEHYDLFMYLLKNTQKEIFIMSPWIRENVVNDEFINELKRLKENGATIKIMYGYKKGKKADTPENILNEIINTKSLGFAGKEETKRVIDKLYNLLGKENFIYAPPTHAKAVIVDGIYMFMGSHNWLSNAGKMSENSRAIEGTIITTSKDAISYAKEGLFRVLDN